MVNFATSCHMLTISIVTQIQEVIYLPVPTLPTVTSDSDTSMLEKAEIGFWKDWYFWQKVWRSCVKHTEEMEIYFGWLIVFLIPKVFI